MMYIEENGLILLGMQAMIAFESIMKTGVLLISIGIPT